MKRRNFRSFGIFLIAAACLYTGLAGGGDLPDPDGKPADMSKPVKVFILMGQSNMFGFGRVGPEGQKGTLEYYVKKEGKYPFLIDDAGKWTERKDVKFVQVMQGAGGMQLKADTWLTPGGKYIGPEIGLGYVLGEKIDEPVLILKTCIGNRSLGWDLLPPGSKQFEYEGYVYAGYKDSPLKWEKGTEPKKIGWYAGKQYDDDVANARKVLADIGKYYPGAKEYEVAGFVWWQGNKDQNDAHASRYEHNLVNLISALRKDFEAPDAKFVCATIAFGGDKLAGPGLKVAEAQLAISDPKKHPELKGGVATVEARKFWRGQDESPSGVDYHYNHNAGTYMDVGLSMGEAMAELLDK